MPVDCQSTQIGNHTLYQSLFAWKRIKSSLSATWIWLVYVGNCELVDFDLKKKVLIIRNISNRLQ